ncbi:MAG: single-stranded-DNA-specific exonuclease RecJ [bacterium]
MSLTGRRWQISRQEKEAAQEISQASRISSTLAQVLINRGLTGISEIDAFITPKLSYLSNPYDIPDMEKAALRVLSAKNKGERVAVYGDYDVDGVTGTSILLLTLKELGIDTTYYIPHRYREGYGLNNNAIKKLFDEGVKLIVTVDCGISDTAEVEYASSLGMDVVITDHHNPPPILPKACAAVNPKLIDAVHRARDLSGAGVAFKFAWGLYRTAGRKDSSSLMELLDLAGLGTIADVVPLLDENRILAIYGLKSLNDCKRTGLKSLMEAAGIKKRVTASSVNFAIAPRLNSAGRLEHASLSVDLLTTKDELKARTLALELNRLNTKRQGIGSRIQAEVFAKIGDAPERSIVISGTSWNPGVIGIVASQVVDRYYRPAVLIGVNEGIGRGSARSIDGINIFGALSECSDLFIDFGGHKKAAGFEIAEDNIPEFTRRMKGILDELIPDEELVPVLEIEAVLPPKEITMGLASELELLDPHGEENPPPIFASYGLKLIDMRKVGDGTHLKTKFTDGMVTVDSIGFSLGDLTSKLRLGEAYDLAYNLEVNEFNGFESAQLNLVDIRNEEKP